VLGFIELSRGEPVAALEYLRRGWEIRDSAMLFEPGHRFELADTLEALVAAGELDEAEARLGPWEERASNLDRSWALSITARCRAMVLSARGDMTAARESFDRALREHARTDDPFQHARTLLAMGVMQRRTKQRAAARASLEQALLIFERLPAPLWAGKARAELKRIGGRAPGKLDELTESERRVAELVAEGRTNQEVAASLFLGERTVASHLTHIYAKLRVRSRTELALRLR
jgi:DNA-binding CsgD family transcriptional regulator